MDEFGEYPFGDDVVFKPECKSELHKTPRKGLQPGVYEHFCPACGETIKFKIWKYEHDERGWQPK